MRKVFSDIKFVGTEPCIKLVKDLGYKNALVVCTKMTLRHNKVLKEYSTASDYLVGDKNLAKIIEDNKNATYRVLPYLVKHYKKYVGKVECVVLGCTHYVFVKKMFEKIFSCPVFDSGFYVAKRVGVMAKSLNLIDGGEIVFCDSANNKEIFWYFNKIAFYSRAKYVII